MKNTLVLFIAIYLAGCDVVIEAADPTGICDLAAVTSVHNGKLYELKKSVKLFLLPRDRIFMQADQYGDCVVSHWEPDITKVWKGRFEEEDSAGTITISSEMVILGAAFNLPPLKAVFYPIGHPDFGKATHRRFQ